MWVLLVALTLSLYFAKPQCPLSLSVYRNVDCEAATCLVYVTQRCPRDRGRGHLPEAKINLLKLLVDSESVHILETASTFAAYCG